MATSWAANGPKMAPTTRPEFLFGVDPRMKDVRFVVLM